MLVFLTATRSTAQISTLRPKNLAFSRLHGDKEGNDLREQMSLMVIPDPPGRDLHCGIKPPCQLKEIPTE